MKKNYKCLKGCVLLIAEQKKQEVLGNICTSICTYGGNDKS